MYGERLEGWLEVVETGKNTIWYGSKRGKFESELQSHDVGEHLANQIKIIVFQLDEKVMCQREVEALDQVTDASERRLCSMGLPFLLPTTEIPRDSDGFVVEEALSSGIYP